MVVELDEVLDLVELYCPFLFYYTGSNKIMYVVYLYIAIRFILDYGDILYRVPQFIRLLRFTISTVLYCGNKITDISKEWICVNFTDSVLELVLVKDEEPVLATGEGLVFEQVEEPVSEKDEGLVGVSV
ncbi:MAG: hypothetical protein ACYS6K_28210 [Planctomycetota bacterium]